MRFSRIKTEIAGSLDQVILSFNHEWRAILSDRGAILVLLIAVWIYPLVYSIAYRTNVTREIPVALVDQDHSALSRQLARMAGATQEIQVTKEVPDMEEAKNLFSEGEVRGVLFIPSGFEKNILTGRQAEVGVYCDAGYFLVYKESLKGSLRAVGTFSAMVEIKRLMAKGVPMGEAKKQRDPLVMKMTSLYNPSGSYGSYVMPGLVVVILQQTLLVGIGMIGGGRREKNHRHLPADNGKDMIFSTLTGRALAYFLLYAFNLLFTQVVLADWFSYPDKGSLADVWLLMVPFLFSVIFMGLTVSLLLKRREHSIMMLVFLSPVVLFLSGMSWPSTSLPTAVRLLARIFPSTTMVPALIRVRTMGCNLSDVRSEMFFLVCQMLVYSLTATLACRIFLHKNQSKVQEQQASEPAID